MTLRDKLIKISTSKTTVDDVAAALKDVKRLNSPPHLLNIGDMESDLNMARGVLMLAGAILKESLEMAQEIAPQIYKGMSQKEKEEMNMDVFMPMLLKHSSTIPLLFSLMPIVEALVKEKMSGASKEEAQATDLLDLFR